MLGVVISLALLAWVLKDVSVAEVLDQARRAHPGLMALSVAIATAAFPLRIFRWRLILKADDGQPVSRRAMWHAIAVGFMANNLLPLRAGEVLRAFTINRIAPVKLTSALSSLIVERMFDGISIVVLLFIGLVTAGIPATTKIAGIEVAAVGTRTAVFLAILLTGCGLALALPDLARRAIRAIIPNERLAPKLIGVFDGIRAGLTALASPGRVVAVLGWSIGLWLFNGLAFYVGYRAFDIGVGFGGALLQQSILVLGIAAPSSPGYVGVFEGAIKAVLGLFGVPSSVAVAFALTYHFATFIPITLLGLYSLVRTGMSLRSASEVTRPA